MSRKRVPADAQIIALFSGLSDSDKEKVMFGLNAIMAMSVPKSIAPSVTRRSSRKGGAQSSTQNTEDDTENASGALVS
jgi:hypothetical protein